MHCTILGTLAPHTLNGAGRTDPADSRSRSPALPRHPQAGGCSYLLCLAERCLRPWDWPSPCEGEPRSAASRGSATQPPHPTPPQAYQTRGILLGEGLQLGSATTRKSVVCQQELGDRPRGGRGRAGGGGVQSWLHSRAAQRQVLQFHQHPKAGTGTESTAGWALLRPPKRLPVGLHPMPLCQENAHAHSEHQKSPKAGSGQGPI